jgi:uncharacterized membrane protein
MMHPVKTMIAPAPGFTARVMTRIAERERAYARRRALIGIALLTLVALSVLALISLLIAAWIAAFVIQSGTIASVVITLVSLGAGLRTMLDALWLGALTLATNVDNGGVLAYGLGVVLLTMLWTRIVIFQHPLAQTS